MMEPGHSSASGVGVARTGSTLVARTSSVGVVRSNSDLERLGGSHQQQKEQLQQQPPQSRTWLHCYGPCGRSMLFLCVFALIMTVFSASHVQFFVAHRPKFSAMLKGHHAGAAEILHRVNSRSDRDPWRKLKEQGKGRGDSTPGASGAGKKGQGKMVALLFYGVPQSLPFTLDSVQKSIVRKIEGAGYVPKVFAHSFADDPFSSGDWQRLDVFRHITTSQVSFMKNMRPDINACKDKTEDAHYVNGVLAGLKSLHDVGNLWEATHLQDVSAYYAVLFLRADTFYKRGFPVDVLANIKEGEVLVPGFHGTVGGLNDQMAVLGPNTALLFKQRLQHALERCHNTALAAERFLKTFTNENNLKVKRLPSDFVFFRVRANGDIMDQDRKLPGYDYVRGHIDGAREQYRAEQAELSSNESLQHPPPKASSSSPKPHPSPPAKQHVTPPPQPTPQTMGDTADEGSGGDGGAVHTAGVPQAVAGGAPKPQKRVHPLSQDFANTVAVCSLMKDEEVGDVREWLEYHRWLGVDKVFLRENGLNISDKYVGTFQEMEDDGFLDFGWWEGQSPAAQQEWYNRCAKEDLAGEMSWILFSDLDEYPVHIKDGVALEEPDLKGYLMRHRGAAGLSLQWVLFGSSGHRERPPGGPLRHFNKCSNQLSYQMKCMASSHHLHEHPFIAPLVLHSCCYKYDEKQSKKKWAPVLYGDGSRALDHKIADAYLLPDDATEDNRTPEQRAAVCRSYEGHLQHHEYDKRWKLPKKEALVLFHYVTRSFQDFRERKLNRYAGAYANDFRIRKEKAVEKGGRQPSDEELFDDLETRLGINKSAPICRSVAKAHYGARCCSRKP